MLQVHAMTSNVVLKGQGLGASHHSTLNAQINEGISNKDLLDLNLLSTEEDITKENLNNSHEYKSTNLQNSYQDIHKNLQSTEHLISRDSI